MHEMALEYEKRHEKAKQLMKRDPVFLDIEQRLRAEAAKLGATAVFQLVVVYFSGSVALLAFGIDSFVESASAAVMSWRLVAERRTSSEEAIEALEARARKLIAVSLFVLAAWVLFDAGRVWKGEIKNNAKEGTL